MGDDETLANPDAHAGNVYALTGSEAITVSEAAKVIADVTGKPVKHNDIDRDVWIQGSVAAGVPAEYGEMLRILRPSPPQCAPALTHLYQFALNNPHFPALRAQQ